MGEATTGKGSRRPVREYAATVRAVPERRPRRAAAVTMLGLAPQGIHPESPEPPRPLPANEPAETLDVFVEVAPLAPEPEPAPLGAPLFVDPQEEEYHVPTHNTLWLQALLIVFSFGIYGVYLLLKRNR